MTEGAPLNKIILFAFPMLIGNIAQQLYSTVDSIVVGKYVGDNALAAVGSSAPVYNLLLVLFIGVSTGSSIMVSQYFGAKDKESLAKSIGNSLSLTAVVSLVIMALSLVVVDPMLHMLGTPDSIFDWCHDYLFILLIGVAGMSYYNILSGVLRGLGDSVSALVYLLIACGINIVLDLYFVAKLNMGVAGVALATVIAQAISALCCLVKILRMTDVFHLNAGSLKMEKKYSMDIVRLGLPSGLTQAIFSMA
ncbi:MAG: MATE family efflux transporter, partial [Oscillospiraceae bacterium]|nr:MATE family efflux transporter [Oscillospiraceae bacterium]